MDAAPPLPGEAPVLRELESLGLPYASLSALRESGLRYVEAVPVLVRGLAAAREDHRVKDELVRALSVPWAGRDALAPLVSEFEDLTNPETLRWVVGNALSIVTGKAALPTLVPLVRDHRYGSARQMLVLRLGRAEGEPVLQRLLGLVDDPTVDGHAVDALARRKDGRAREALKAKIDDPRAWVARAARRGLAALEASPGS